MTNLIYKVFIIQIVLNYEAYTREINMTNISEVIGTKDIRLRCSYILDSDDRGLGVTFHAVNDSDAVVKVAESSIFGIEIFPYGEYLFDSANITKFSDSSSEVVLTFDNLKCKHERNYICGLSIKDQVPTVSTPMKLFVQVPPVKPDIVKIMKAPIDVSTTTDTARVDTSSSSVTSLNTGTSSEITKSPLTLSQLSNSSTTALLLNFTTSIFDNNTTSTTNTFYNSTSSTEPTPESPNIIEGDNITVKCSGNVGKPAGIFTFQVLHTDSIRSTTYNATVTEIVEIPGNCSYYRTSYLTFQVTAEDNLAVMRCAVVSSLVGEGVYVDSEQLEVKYKVRKPTVTKHPDKQEYIVGVDTSITLTCTSDGNPKPSYRWYKDNHGDINSTAANFTLRNINTTDSGQYFCNVSNNINENINKEATEIDVNIVNEADKSTTKSTSTSSSSGAVDTTGDSSKNLDPVIGGVGGVGGVLLIIIIISCCVYTRRKKTSKIPSNKNESEGSVDSKLKPIAESRTGNYDYIALEDDPPKTNSSNNGLEVEDINKHNAEYLKKQEEEEKKKNESNTPPQPAVYAQVDEASKLKNKQKSETLEMPDKQEEDPYAETQEGVYDETGNPRYKENKNAEQFDVSTNSSKQNSNGDNKLSIQTSQVGSYANLGFEKDENRKVATVSPTVRSSSGSQNDEQTNSNRDSQSKKGYENIIGTDQTGISEEESPHRTAL